MSLFEIGGKVDITAMALANYDIKDKSYKKDEVIFNLQNIDASFNFKGKSSASTTDLTVLNDYWYALSSVDLKYVPLYQNLCDLFSKEYDNTVDIIKEENIPAINKTLFLTTQHDISDVRIENIENINNITINNSTHSIKSDEFITGQEYHIVYKEKHNCYSFLLNSKEENIPYIKFQFAFRGNNDKNDTQGYLFIEKAKVHFTPTLIFDSKNVAYCQIVLEIIHDNITKAPRFVIIDE